MTGIRLVLTIAQKAKAASAYRSLIRSSKFTFASDHQTYHQFMNKAKDLFTSKVLNPKYLLDSDLVGKGVNAGQTSEQEAVGRQFETEIQGVLQLSKYLTRNIVQGEHLGDGKRIVLRLTDKTEIGDNTSIKNPKPITSNQSASSTCCSQSPSMDPTPKLSAAALERREKRRLNRLQQSHLLTSTNPQQS